jgi:hypothetical protein
VLENHDDVVVKQAKAKVKYEIQTFTSWSMFVLTLAPMIDCLLFILVFFIKDHHIQSILVVWI